MAEFVRNARRLTPYLNFKFRVKWDNRYVAGVSKVSGIKRTTEIVPQSTGGDSRIHKAPGRTSFGDVTLERGLSHDWEFQRWATMVWNYEGGMGAQSSLANFKRPLTLELYNEAGQLVIAWNFFECWAAEIELGDWDANGNAVAIEKLKFATEGFVRDPEVREPTEPTLSA